MSEETEELFEKLSEKITEVCDMEHSEEITELFEDLASIFMEVLSENSELREESNRYWDLVKKLAKCEKERDEERNVREQAEYDAEYYAKELKELRLGERNDELLKTNEKLSKTLGELEECKLQIKILELSKQLSEMKERNAK